MEKVKVRHKHAEELEAKAREQAEARSKIILKSRALIEPPPETELLGCWRVIEESFVKQGRALDDTLGERRIIFETLLPDLKVFGRSTIGDSLVLTPSHSGLSIPYCQNTLEGRLESLGKVRFGLTPTIGSHMRMLAKGMAIIGELHEASWKGYQMEGYAFNDLVGTSMEYRAVKLDE